MAPVLPLLAQQAVPDSLLGWLTGSAVTVLAFITWAWLTGRIVTGTELKRCQGKLDAVEAELRRIAHDDRTLLIPALTRATDVLANYVERKADATPVPPTRGSS